MDRRSFFFRAIAESEAGMTLIEIMVVITILGMIAGGVAVAVIRQLERSKLSSAKIEICNLRNALTLYYNEFNDYPGTSDGLQGLITPPGGGKGLITHKTVPKDPWGQEYVYVYPGLVNPDAYDLLSKGPDKREGGGDDVDPKECN